MKKLKWVLFACLTVQLWGCTSPSTYKIEKPQNLLSEDKMVQLYVDIHILEGTMPEIPVPKDSAVKMYQILEKGLLKKHGVDDSTYAQSHRYYYSNPDIYNKIYERVIDSLKHRSNLPLN